MNTERINKVLALAMDANPNLPIPLSIDNIDLDDITYTPNGIRNTRATMYARDTGEIVRYVGDVEVMYDRIDIAQYWQHAVLIEDPVATTVKDLVSILRTRYGLDVLDTEILNPDTVLPDQGDVVIVIDDTSSPLYIGTVTVAFTKDAGLSEHDGVAYVLPGTVGDTPIVAYTDSLVTLQGSLNNTPWQTLIATRNKSTKQYEHRFPVALSQNTNDIRIRGAVVALMDNDGTYVPITQLTTYKGAVDATGYCAGMRSLRTIAPDVFRLRPDLQRADYLFDGCTGITVLPEHVFSPCLQLTSAVAVFRRTSITTIPVSVFESCSKLTDLTSAFEQCVKLTTIPDGLFKTNTALTVLRRCFLGCYAVGDNPITAAFLANNTQLTDIGYLFADVPGIVTIPTGLLKNQSLLTKVDGLFSQCYGLAAIPADMFLNNPKLNTVSAAFKGCARLSSIPPGLFQNTPDLEYAEETFAQTGILTTPEVMFTYTRRLLSIDRIFSNCLQLRVIPNNLLQPLLRLQSANGVWWGCAGITAIPLYLLRTNVNLLSIVGLFAYTGIQALEAGCLQWQTKVKDFSSLFEGTPISAVPQSILSFMVNATTANRVFYKCTRLTTLPNLLFNWNIKLTSVNGCFAYCSTLSTSINGLFNHLSLTDPNPLVSVLGLFQGAPYVSGSFATFKTEYPNVDWTDSATTQGCIAGATALSDYASAGTIYKTPVPSLV